MEELVIIGGGVGGLGCLNALLDRDISPLLLEAASIGSPKMCGEFLAPPVMEPLKKWGIGPMRAIKQAQFFGAKNRLQFSFSREAGAYARHNAEVELAARAKKQGGRILEQSPIKDIIPATHNSPFILHLTSGETIQACDVIFATGKFSQQIKTSLYVGFKTHIPQIILPETLLMFSLAGGYLGIVPVTSETSNLTCLVKREVIERAGSCRRFLHQFENYVGWALAQQQNGIEEHCWARAQPTRFSETIDWLEGPAPAFGLKTIPNWPHAYWIGDAFASVHPAIGYGFAHSVTSALLAADYYLKHDPVGYHQALRRLMRPKRIIGQCMHHILQKPRLCSVISPLIGANTWISHRLLKTLDY